MIDEEAAESANETTLSLIPREQLDRVFTSEVCDIGPEFLGFMHIYDSLAKVIPKDWTVVDLGCAYAPQAWLFAGHARYIGVDLPWESNWLPAKLERFIAPNTTIFEMSIEEFIGAHIADLDLKTTFAICSYVPPWGGDNMKRVRDAFMNVFTFYPASTKPRPVIDLGGAARFGEARHCHGERHD